MRRRERDVEEEGLGFAGEVADILDRVFGDRVCVIEILPVCLDRRVVAGQAHGIVIAAAAFDCAEVFLKTALEGPIVLIGGVRRRNVPLAGHRGAVPRAAQQFRDRDTLPVQIAAIAGLAVIAGHVPDSGLMRVQPGHQAGTARATAGAVVELPEREAVLREGVQVRRRDLAAVAP